MRWTGMTNRCVRAAAVACFVAALVTAGGPAKPRKLGGDEVGLFYAPYVAVHTDRRLFIADPGNARIVSVKLDYHVTERIRLGSVPGD